jgi:hypothetical protein
MSDPLFLLRNWMADQQQNRFGSRIISPQRKGIRHEGAVGCVWLEAIGRLAADVRDWVCCSLGGGVTKRSETDPLFEGQGQ